MLKRLLRLFNIKPSEAGLVKDLFLVQFALGVATAFLYTGSLTLFLSDFSIRDLPKVFLLSAVLILAFNRAYAWFEHRLSPGKLLELVVLFSLGSTLAFWLVLQVTRAHWLVMLLAAWNALVYMLIGYAFWGLAALLFNVRESKRVFSIVGSGDIPAKMIGYLFVSFLVHLTPVVNLLWIPILSLACCRMLIRRLDRRLHLGGHESGGAAHDVHPAAPPSFGSRIVRAFHSKLVLFISLVSLLAYIIFLFVDFTFLAEIKLKYHEQKELASFIAVFFAGGRIFAILVKVLLSSRMIAKIGLLNSLMITPLLLLAINAVVIFSGGSLSSHLYIFGAMVLLIEVLRSTVQEPVFFILFQPLKPHDRLKGHLIAKGYTFPLALLAVGGFLLFYLDSHTDVSILFLSKAIFAFLVAWIGVIFLIRSEYIQTLVSSLKRGYFTGTDLFLNDEGVFATLVRKVNSGKPLEVIHALNLLERSRYPGIVSMLLDQLQHSASPEVKSYVLDRVIANRLTSVLPIIRKQAATEAQLPALYKALFYLDGGDAARWEADLQSLSHPNMRAALTGLSLRQTPEADGVVHTMLQKLAEDGNEEAALLALDVLSEAREPVHSSVLRRILKHPAPSIHRRAMEVAGKIHDFSLFEEVLSSVVEQKAYYALEKTLVEYGDEAFDEDRLTQLSLLPERGIRHLVKAAARIRGPRSDHYLFQLFSTDPSRREAVVDALWKKKAAVGLSRPLLENWTRDRLEQMRTKVDCFLNVHHHKKAELLGNALSSETEQNLETVLKAFALLYDREPIDRFLEVYYLEDVNRIANAIELLEMTLPKKYFTAVLYFIDLGLDLRKNQCPQVRREATMDLLISEVATHEGLVYAPWSRSVALYVSPRLLSREVALSIVQKAKAENEGLVGETRNYVLSILK